MPLSDTSTRFNARTLDLPELWSNFVTPSPDTVMFIAQVDLTLRYYCYLFNCCLSFILADEIIKEVVLVALMFGNSLSLDH